MIPIFCTQCGVKLVKTPEHTCLSCGAPYRITDGLTKEIFLQADLQGRNKWWHWVIGIFTVVMAWQVIGTMPLYFFCISTRLFSIYGFQCAPSQLIVRGPSHVPGFILTMFPFIIGTITLAIVVRWFHNKSFATLLTGRKRFDLSRTLFAMAVVGTMSAISLALELFANVAPENEGELIHNRISYDWAALAFFAFTLVPVQAGLEEVFFRGYLLQGMSLVSRSKIFLLFSTTTIFTAVHLANPEPWEYGVLPYLFSVFALGTFMGLITILDDGLELAIGFHTANNLWSFLVVGLEKSAIPTPALFILKIDDLNIGHAIAPILIQLFVIFIAFAWRYGWFAKLKHRSGY